MSRATRKVLAWRLSNTMDAGFCVAVLEDALASFGRPKIFDTDQGSQFTSQAFTNVLRDVEVCISKDGRGKWMDNAFIERFWRSLKCECVYLHAFETGSKLRAGLARWITNCNTLRPHSGLAGRTPVEAYRRNALPQSRFTRRCMLSSQAGNSPRYLTSHMRPPLATATALRNAVADKSLS